MRRRTVAIASVVVIGAAIAGVLAAVGTGTSDADDGATRPTSGDRQLATVERRDMVRTTTLDGTVGRGDTSPLTLSGEGTITRLPAVGDTVASGQILLEVDGAPVVLLAGDRPAWRELRSGMSDGEDVRQLEQALADLGYATSSLVVDDEWTSATTASLKQLQDALGMEDDGRLSLGELVFSPRTVRIASIGGHLGDRASDAAIEVTGEAQVIEVDVDTSDADLLTPGTTVTVELPNGDEVPGTVYSVGAPETGDGGGSLPVVVVADGLDAVDGLDVEIVMREVDVAGATAVPAAALLALAEGGYAVEIPDDTSPTGTRLVAVELGTFDEDGWVEVGGDVEPGDQVVVP